MTIPAEHSPVPAIAQAFTMAMAGNWAAMGSALADLDEDALGQVEHAAWRLSRAARHAWQSQSSRRAVSDSPGSGQGGL